MPRVGLFFLVCAALCLVSTPFAYAADSDLSSNSVVEQLPKIRAAHAVTGLSAGTTICRAGSAGHFALVSNGHASAKNAAALCSSVGLTLAAVKSATWKKALSVVRHCNGPKTGAWIKSWNGDSYRQHAMELRVNAHAIHGSVVVPYSAWNPALCEPCKK